MLQIRPRYSAGVRDPMYAPHRDIAYIGPQLLFVAIERVLRPELWEPWFKQMMELNGISLEALNEGAMRLSAAFADVASLRCGFDEALRRSGFTSLPGLVQGIFYVQMGKMLLAAMHRGIGDITDYDGPVPPTVSAMCEDIAKAAGRLPGNI